MAKQLLRVFVNQFPHNEQLFRGVYSDSLEIPVEQDPKTGYPKSGSYDSKPGKLKRVRVEGIKHVVNGMHVRGLVLLYTSRTPDMVAVEELNYNRKVSDAIRPRSFPSSAIVGAAEIFYGDSAEGIVCLRNIKRFPLWIPFKPAKGCVRWAKVPLKVVEQQLKEVGLLRLARKNILAA